MSESTEIELKKLHTWLFENNPSYRAMVAVGSDVTGDRKVEGRSDHGLILIFAGEFSRELAAMRKELAHYELGDDFLFTPFTKDDFVRSHNSSHDFSRRFAAATLFGEDLVPHVQLPEFDAIRAIYNEGLTNFYWQFLAQTLNAGFWSEKKVRSSYWSFAKDAFAHLAVKQYYDTRKYPATREELVQALDSPAVIQALKTFNNVNAAAKDEIVAVSQTLLDYAASVID